MGLIQPPGGVPAIVDLPAQTSEPSAAATGNGRFFMDKYAKTLPAARGAMGPAYPLDRADWHNLRFLISPSTGAANNQQGYGAAAAASGTRSTVTPAGNLPLYTNLVSAASTNSEAAFLQSQLLFTRGGGQWFGGFELHAYLYFPDASYNESGASTGTRIRFGLSDETTANGFWGTDHGRATFAHAGFFRDHVNGGVTDTNWFFVTNDGATSVNATDTGVAFTAQRIYGLHMSMGDNGSSIDWMIESIVPATGVNTRTAGSVSSDLPDTTDFMNFWCGLRTIDAVARNVGVISAYASAAKG